MTIVEGTCSQKVCFAGLSKITHCIYIFIGNRGLPWFMFFAFLVMKTSGILFFGPILALPEFYYLAPIFFGPTAIKNKIPEVFITKKAKKYIYLYKYSQLQSIMI